MDGMRWIINNPQNPDEMCAIRAVHDSIDAVKAHTFGSAGLSRKEVSVRGHHREN